ncbi:MAG: DUF3662 and FHA domain-containing protein [Chloroflexi bacterium]|jgi:hypothetical protein|nr:DUF3662 and FHA domain-containing protein [Chloroflexota bacterium]
MTRPLVAIERFFERLFERPATRLFNPRLQPVQLQRRLERAMESERRISHDRTYVPDRYRIALNPRDFGHFEGYRSTLESDLSEALLKRARQRGYTLLARPRIWLEPTDEVRAGDITVLADVLDPAALTAAASGLRRVEGDGPRPPRSPEPPLPPTRAAPPSGRPFESNATLAYQVPANAAPAAIIEIAGPGMAPQRVAFRGGTLRVGRGPENDIVLSDERVSRQHGTFTTRQGAFIYTDGGSTNGSFVNGSLISEIALGSGDVVRLGSTTLTIHPDR